MEYVPGPDIGNADGLSRMFNDEEAVNQPEVDRQREEHSGVAVFNLNQWDVGQLTS